MADDLSEEVVAEKLEALCRQLQTGVVAPEISAEAFQDLLSRVAALESLEAAKQLVAVDLAKGQTRIAQASTSVDKLTTPELVRHYNVKRNTPTEAARRGKQAGKPPMWTAPDGLVWRQTDEREGVGGSASSVWVLVQ